MDVAVYQARHDECAMQVEDADIFHRCQLKLAVSKDVADPLARNDDRHVSRGRPPAAIDQRRMTKNLDVLRCLRSEWRRGPGIRGGRDKQGKNCAEDWMAPRHGRLLAVSHRRALANIDARDPCVPSNALQLRLLVSARRPYGNCVEVPHILSKPSANDTQALLTQAADE